MKSGSSFGAPASPWPYVYHLAEISNWPSIQRYGLLSTRLLLDLAGVSGVERVQIEQHRTERVLLPNGIAVRDQKPMPPATLERCLVGMTPVQWYGLLNSKVFFWFDIDRLNRMRQACKNLPQVVLVIDTEKLLARHAARVALTPINTGNARRVPALRGQATFVPYTTWSTSGWTSESISLGTRPRPRHQQPVELTVSDAVPDVMDLVVRVHLLEPGENLTR